MCSRIGTAPSPGAFSPVQLLPSRTRVDTVCRLSKFILGWTFGKELRFYASIIVIKNTLVIAIILTIHAKADFHEDFTADFP